MSERLEVPVVHEPPLKRGLDIALSLIGLVLSAPLWPFVALITKIQGPGPVFYRQKRWGRGGVPFEVIKFRTMSTGGPRTDIEHGVANDPRVTRLGRVLRKTGLDELPQLVAILRGQMTLVGPRPLAVGERVRDTDGSWISYEEIPGFLERLTVRPGLTGASTVHLPRDASPRKKFEADLRYIESRTFGGDLGLLARSIINSLTGAWDRYSRSS